MTSELDELQQQIAAMHPAIDEIEAEIGARDRGPAPSVESYIAKQIARRKWSRDTSLTRPNVLRAFCAWAQKRGIANVQDLKVVDAQEFYDDVAARVKDITANSYISVMHGCWVWLVDAGLAITNPWHKLERRPGANYGRVRWVEFEEAQRLIAAAPDDEFRFFLYCGFHAGMRRGEIDNARPGWFDLARQTVAITSEEGGWVRKCAHITKQWVHLVPISDEFTGFLRRWLPTRTGAYCLRPEVGYGDLYRYRYPIAAKWRAFMAEQGMPWVTPHVMRHSYATFLLDRGVSLFEVAGLIGDTVAVVERHYGHRREDNHRVAAIFRSAAAEKRLSGEIEFAR